MSGLIYKLKNDLLIEIAIGNNYKLRKNEAQEYIYLSQHPIG